MSFYIYTKTKSELATFVFNVDR